MTSPYCAARGCIIYKPPMAGSGEIFAICWGCQEEGAGAAPCPPRSCPPVPGGCWHRGDGFGLSNPMGLGTTWWPLQACSIPGTGLQSPGRGAKLLVLKKAALTAGQQAPAPAGAPGTAGTARNGSAAGPGAPYSHPRPLCRQPPGGKRAAPGPFPPGRNRRHASLRFWFCINSLSLLFGGCRYRVCV